MFQLTERREVERIVREPVDIGDRGDLRESARRSFVLRDRDRIVSNVSYRETIIGQFVSSRDVARA